MGISTAAQQLYQNLPLPIPCNTSVRTNHAILIYSGATATGSLAIQLAKLYAENPSPKPPRRLMISQIWLQSNYNLLREKYPLAPQPRRRRSHRLQPARRNPPCPPPYRGLWPLHNLRLRLKRRNGRLLLPMLCAPAPPWKRKCPLDFLLCLAHAGEESPPTAENDS